MHNIHFISGSDDLVERIRPLWEKLSQHHAEVARYFSEDMHRMDFDRRKSGLLTKASKDFLRVDVAIDQEIDIGYCISTIVEGSYGRTGEIESLFLEESYRKLGIGERLMKMAVEWLDANSVDKKILGVLVGNDSTFGFYAKFGFYPRTTILQQKRIELIDV